MQDEIHPARLAVFGSLARKAGRLARIASAHPREFLRHLIRQAIDYERFQAAGRRGLDAIIETAIEERLQAFLNSPPSSLLPSKRLEDLCGPAPAASNLPTLGEPDGSELPEAERLALARLVHVFGPKTLFEIGTYRGRTTRLLAACAQPATVHTLDLPPEDMLLGGCFREINPGLIGLDFRRTPQTQSRIIQHYGDSRQFDFAPFRRQIDMVFVDASHAYEAVLNDSRRALDMVTEDGLVVWDDYHPVHGPGVMRALAELTSERSLVWIRGTRLAICGPFAEPSGASKNPS